MQSPGEYGFFYQAKILSGIGAMANIPVELDGFDARHPFVLASKSVTDSGLAKKFVKALYESNTVIGALYDDVPAYASARLVKELAQFFRDRGCDSIVAIGRGSVIDVARGVNIAVSTGNDDVLAFEGANKIPSHLKPFVAVPTCAPAPLDLTNRAVIDGRQFVSNFLYPDIIAADTTMVRGCCAECVLETAMASLAHALEAYLSQSANPVSDSYAYMALQFVAENLGTIVRKPKNKEASLAMANAAVSAGAAFSNLPAGVVHALGMALASVTGHPAGLCMGIVLPASIEYQRKQKRAFRGDLLKAVSGFDAYAETPAGQRGEKGIRAIQSLLAGIDGLPKSLAELRVAGYLAKEAVEAAAKANPHLKKQELAEVMDMSMAGAR
ncbi:MAG: iron-containing alcohol dehydrogenase [Spirochaetes bacterium]|nr:iron-containing alcohol dehydrogenase [Spirochaetota bacterium]